MTEASPRGDAAPVARFPLSATQARCWFLDRLRPGNPALNVPFRWDLRGDLEPAEIEAAIRATIARHEILRTRFAEEEGEPVQEVMEAAPFRLDQVDIRAVAEAERAERIEEIARGESQRAFDLSRPGLIRACHVRLSADRAMLLITVHQSCFDGYSIGVLGREMAEQIRARRENRAPNLPEPELQYGDYALWQRDLFASGLIEEERDWWLGQLEGAPYFEVPTDRPRPEMRGAGAAQVHLMMPDGFGERLETAARRLEASPFALGAAVVSACLHRITGGRDILFGTQVAGRADTMLDDVIGVFINNLVLRVDAHPERSLADQVAAARRTVEGALAHQTLPFDRLVGAVNPRRDPARTPLISCNYTLQKVFMAGEAGPGFEIVSAPSHVGGAIYDLGFILVGRTTGWRLNVEYATELFEAGTAQAIAELIRDAFEALFADPDAPLSSLPLPEALRNRSAPLTPGMEPRAPSRSGDIEEMRAIWSDVLGVPDVPDHASFFDLGGHSLLVVRMLARLRERTGAEVDLAAVYRAPTLAALAEAASGAPQPAPAVPAPTQTATGEDWRILPLTTAGAGLPIIGINNAATILAAATAPGAERPATCIRLHDGEGGGILGTPLGWSEIGRRYADLAEVARPEGPILLYGNCVHGNLAVETARQLAARGREIAGVVLKDTWEPGYVSRMQGDRALMRRERWLGLRNRIRLWREGRMSVAAILGSYRIVRMTGIPRLHVALGLSDRVRSSDLESAQEAFNLYLADARDAAPAVPVDLPILHVVTRITPQGKGFAPSIGWEQAATGRLDTVRIDDVSVWRGREVGVAALGAAIAGFLGEDGQPR